MNDFKQNKDENRFIIKGDLSKLKNKLNEPIDSSVPDSVNINLSCIKF